jgi:four helix bundle protein
MVHGRWYDFQYQIIEADKGKNGFQVRESRGLEYLDGVYRTVNDLPKEELYNLRSQWIRAATSITLNIAEGSTGQANSGQVRFLGYAIRSLMESAVCDRIAKRREFLSGIDDALESQTVTLVKKLPSFRKSIQEKQYATRR